MKSSSYVLEVVKYIQYPNSLKIGDGGWLHRGGRVVHRGYMKAKFKTRSDAISYYNRHNPHMNPMDLTNNDSSDWDPYSQLKYIIREDHGIEGRITPFNLTDAPENTSIGESSYIHYSWLS